MRHKNQKDVSDDGDIELLDLETSKLLQFDKDDDEEIPDSIWSDISEVYNKFRYGYGIPLTLIVALLISYHVIIGQYQLINLLSKPVPHTWETLVSLFAFI